MKKILIVTIIATICLAFILSATSISAEDPTPTPEFSMHFPIISRWITPMSGVTPIPIGTPGSGSTGYPAP
jgi:hypothetical protein